MTTGVTPIRTERTARTIPESRIVSLLQRQGYDPAQIQSYLHPEAATQPTPAQIAQTAQQSAASQSYEKPSGWQSFLSTLSKPFEWIDEKIAKPLASIITSPWTPSNPNIDTTGMNWFERERAEYNDWDAPSWDTGLNLPSWLGGGDFTLGVKGGLEMLPYLIPGGAIARPVAGAAKALKAVSGASAAAKTARVAGNVLETGAKVGLAGEYAAAYPIAKPLSLLTGNRLKMLETPAQQLARMSTPKAAASTVVKSIGDMRIEFAPEGMLAAQLLPHNKVNAGLIAGKVKGLKSLAEVVFGKTATTNNDDLVRLAQLDSVANAERAKSVVGVHNAVVKNSGDIDKVFGIDERGLAMNVEPLKDVTGNYIPLSNQFSDIIENRAKYPGLTPEQAKILDAARDAQQAMIDFGYDNGIFKSRDFFWHRKVKGIESGENIIEKGKGSLKGRSGQVSRVHETAAGGSAKGVVYDHPYKQLEEFQNAVIQAVANKRQVDLLTPLGRTAMDKMNPALYMELTMAKEGDRSAKLLVNALRRASRGEKLPGATMAKLQRDFPEIAKALQETTTIPAGQSQAELAKSLITRRTQLANEIKDTGIDAVARAGKQAELDAIKILNGKGLYKDKLNGLQAELDSIRTELQARSAPFHGGMRQGGNTKGITTTELNAKEQALSKFIEGLPKDLISKSPRVTAFSDLISQANQEAIKSGTKRLKLSHIQAEAMKRAKSPFMTNLTEEQVRALKGQINKTTGKPYQVGDLVPEAMSQNKNLMGHIFPEPLAAQIDKVGAKEADKWLKACSKLSSVSRQLTATFDLSWPAIQGLPVMGRNPAAWAKATLKQYEFAFHPDRVPKFMTEHSQTLYDMTMHGSTIQRSEYTEAGGMIGKWAETKATSRVGKTVKPVVGKGNEQTLERANAAWTGASVAARVYMWEAQAPRMAATELTALARSLDRMVGVMNTATMMYGPNSKELMNAFGLFAHQYTGASLSLIRDTLSGGLKGTEARKALGNMMTSGTAMYFGVCKLTGQEPDLDPTSANFMTLNVGGQNVGFGSIYYSLARLGGNVMQATADVAEGEKKLTDILGFNKTDNPFNKFLFSRTAPLTGTAVQLMEGTNYFGEPFEGIGDYAAFLSSKVTPFWMQVLGEQGGLNPAIIGANVAGMRTYPKGEWEQIEEKRETYAQSDYGKRWDQLNKLEQDRVMSGHADIVALRDRWNEGQIARGSENALFWQSWDEINTEYSNKLWSYQEAVDSGQMSLSDFRAAIGDAGTAKGAQQDYLKNQYPDVVKKWTNPKEAPDYVGDIAYDEYVSTMYDNLTDQYGIYNFNERQKREATFKTKWGDDIYTYVMDRLREGKDDPPLMQEYRQVQDMLRPYWNVKDELLALSDNADLEELDRLATEVGKTDPGLEDYMRSGKAVRLADGSIIRCTALSRLQRQIQLIRQYKRANNPELDAALSAWYS